MADLETFDVDPFDFDDEAAGKVTEWERLLADADSSYLTDLAGMDGMDDDQLTYLGSLTYTPYEPKPKESDGTGA